MRALFERAAFRAGWLAARAGVLFHENPLCGALARFAPQWGRGWAAANEFQFSCSDWERFGDMARPECMQEVA